MVSGTQGRVCFGNNAPCVQGLREPSESDLEHVQARMYGPPTSRVIGRHFPTLPVGLRRMERPAWPRSLRPARPSPRCAPAGCCPPPSAPSPWAATGTPLSGQPETSNQEGTRPAGVKMIKSLLKVTLPKLIYIEQPSVRQSHFQRKRANSSPCAAFGVSGFNILHDCFPFVYTRGVRQTRH